MIGTTIARMLVDGGRTKLDGSSGVNAHDATAAAVDSHEPPSPVSAALVAEYWAAAVNGTHFIEADAVNIPSALVAGNSLAGTPGPKPDRCAQEDILDMCLGMLSRNECQACRYDCHNHKSTTKRHRESACLFSCLAY